MRNVKNDTALLKSLEPLAPLGGFIKDYIEELACAEYGGHMIDLISPYIPVGPGFSYSIEAVKEAMKNMNEYSPYSWKQEARHIPFAFADKKFCDFVTSQIARLSAKRLNNNEEMDYLLSADLPPGKKECISKLNLLDIRILYLISKKKLSAYEISKLPEFKCSEMYINSVLNKIDEKNYESEIFDKSIAELME